MGASNATAPGADGSDPLPFPHLPSTDPPPPDPSADRCHLFGTTALIVQALMGVFVIGSLVAKRHIEKRKRPWRVWMLDVGKQLVGQAVIHGLNILISSVVATASDKNPCSLYFLNILIDTTVGVIILWLALKGFTSLFVQHYGPEGYTSGQYGHPPQWRFWGRQLQPYLAAIVTMKLIVLLPLTLPKISNWIIRAGQEFLSVFSVNAQVIFVLAVFPVIMNVFQFCVVDHLIKERKGKNRADDDTDDLQSGIGGGYIALPIREADDTSYPRTHTPGPSGSGLPRRRSSARDLTKSSPSTSRSNSISGSAPSSPLFAAEDARLLGGSGSSGSRKTNGGPTPLALGESVWSTLAKKERDEAPADASSAAWASGSTSRSGAGVLGVSGGAELRSGMGSQGRRSGTTSDLDDEIPSVESRMNAHLSDDDRSNV